MSPTIDGTRHALGVAATALLAMATMMSRRMKFGTCNVMGARQSGHLLSVNLPRQCAQNVCPHDSDMALCSVSKLKFSMHTEHSKDDVIKPQYYWQ